ncbi:MAG: VWA domain-containing protein [Treponema sp.]|nr:VWA domain-containing protein [Treponema sp.]
MTTKNFCIALCMLPLVHIYALDLTIAKEDLRIEQRVDGGFHLFIRKKPDIASALIAESTKDFTYNEPNYAYRAPLWNAINGDEMRIVNGAPLSPASGIWSLIDSSPERDEQFGEAFHIYIPYILYYGYETGRHGELYVRDGAYFNLRAFALPYGDYAGAFQDNPFVLEVTQKPLPGPPDGNYMGETLATFSDISRKSGGGMALSSAPEDIAPQIRDILEKEKGKSLDVVVCLDTTGSMKDDIAAIKKSLAPVLSGMRNEFPSFRMGLTLFKDYKEAYVTKVIPFATTIAAIQREIDRITVGGGKDTPEAVYEALYDGATKFPWEAQSRLIILIGDAPPHPRPVGAVTREMTEAALAEKNITVYTIALPQ